MRAAVLALALAVTMTGVSMDAQATTATTTIRVLTGLESWSTQLTIDFDTSSFEANSSKITFHAVGDELTAEIVGDHVDVRLNGDLETQLAVESGAPDPLVRMASAGPPIAYCVNLNPLNGPRAYHAEVPFVYAEAPVANDHVHWDFVITQAGQPFYDAHGNEMIPAIRHPAHDWLGNGRYDYGLTLSTPDGFQDGAGGHVGPNCPLYNILEP
jgi:hypothetical protein